MRLLSWVLLGVAMLWSPIGAAEAETGPGTAIYRVTYFDIVPSDFDKAVGLLRAFAEATRHEDGNVEFTLLDETGRRDRMAMIEAWRDKPALDAHQAAVRAMAQKLGPFIAAAFDTREFVPLSIAQHDNATRGTAIYVVTHIDVFPAGKDTAAAEVKDFAEASRKEKGEERFDALVSDAHPNHFHLIEAWVSRPALAAHAASDQTRMFRAKLVPLEGALYDERLYEVVK
ncbi:MAG: antibiotic biosynthesis monooxygenase [Acetobacteraceae bacterium]|nr:antibiotic biosynthesis monooxygenase [Acetobacteraceae bacterium]